MGYEVTPPEFDAIASKLRGSANDLDGAASTPPVVDGGEVSSLIDGMLELHTESLAGIAEGVGAAGDGVAADRDAYVKAEHEARDGMPGNGGR